MLREANAAALLDSIPTSKSKNSKHLWAANQTSASIELARALSLAKSSGGPKPVHIIPEENKNF